MYITPDPYWFDQDNDGDKSGNGLMIRDNQNLYVCTFTSYEMPEYASVYIVDTSGSMQFNDYEKCKVGITEAISEYNCFPGGTHNSRMWLYSGTWLSNISSQQLATLSFTSATGQTIFNAVSPVINSIPKQSSSEAMITCLYCAIIDIHDKMLLENDLGTWTLKSLNFVLCTDESIFTNDTLKDYNKLKTDDYPWFKNWQSSSTSKFPSALPSVPASDVSAAEAAKQSFARKITEALKQMSRYYGVNISWGLVNSLASTGNKNNLSGVIPFINDLASTGSVKITYKHQTGI